MTERPSTIDDTHSPDLQSWIESANDPGTDFPIQNLPLCSFCYDDAGVLPTLGIVVGDRVIDLEPLENAGLLLDETAVFGTDAHAFAELTPSERRRLRQRISGLLRADNPELRDNAALRARSVFALDEVELFNPIDIGDYTDFYASVHHATNVGTMFRPDNPLMPNYKWLPVGYHGRASSIVPSGTGVVRPSGQKAPANEGDPPAFSPCALLDYELEMGAFIGRGNELGEPVPVAEAENHLLGLCLLNDWSARDLQKWEYQPLGPFLAKNFCSSISPFIVTMEALAPFRAAREARPDTDPAPLPHLDCPADRDSGGFDIKLEVYLASAKMREAGHKPQRISAGNFKTMYWTFAQMLAHHSSSGCNMQPGDLIGSGTVSGPDRASRGCLLELTWNGGAGDPKPGTDRTPLKLPTGEERKFLEDGDEVIFKGYCERDGYRRIGFGECRGIILPARS